MIRITGGQFKGQQIQCPKGQAIRPTTAFVRESLFSIWQNCLPQARFLDLFAGCGIVGLEALSRGASCVTAVEKAPAHCRLLKSNAEKLGVPVASYEIICRDVFDWLKSLRNHPAQRPMPYDLVFVDPPFRLEEVSWILQACFEVGLIASTGQLVWESPPHQEPVDIPWATRTQVRRYSTSTVHFYIAQGMPEKE